MTVTDNPGSFLALVFNRWLGAEAWWNTCGRESSRRQMDNFKGEDSNKLLDFDENDQSEWHEGPVSTGDVSQQPTSVLMTYSRVVVQPAGPPPSNYMWLSVIAFCCCVPLGVYACSASNQSSRAATAGDYETAESKGQTARAVSIVAIILGTIITVIYLGIKLSENDNTY